jgi:hypothetical protein
MGLLIYAGLVFLLGFAALKRQSRLLLILLQIQSFLFVFVFFWLTRPDYQIIQVRKLGYEFDKITNDFRNPARPVLFGRDQQKDDVFIQDIPAGAVRLTPSLASSDTKLSVLKDGIFILRNSAPLNALFLKDGDHLNCGKYDLVFFSRGAFGRGFQGNGKEWIWPRKEWRIQKQKEPVLTANVDSHVYSLSNIVAALGGSCTSNAGLALQQIRFTATRNPVQMNAVFLLGAGNDVQLNGTAIPNTFTIHDQDDITLFGIHKNERSVHFQSAGKFRVSNGEAFDLILSSPLVLGIKEDLLRNGSKTNKPLLVTTSSLPYSVFPTARYSQESNRFSGLFAFVQTQKYEEASGFMEQVEQNLQRFLSIRPADLEVVTEDGSFRPRYGDRFTLGDSSRMILTVNRVDFPWILLQALCILWLAKMLYQPPFFAAIENVPMQLLVITADFFLVTRFLFSFRASNLYPFSNESLTLSLFAILIVPYLLFSGPLMIRAAWERRHTWNFAGYTLIICLLAGILIPGYVWLTISVGTVMSAIAFLRFHPRGLHSQLERCRQAVSLVPIEIALGVFILFTFVLQLLGTGEAVEAFGIRFPLSLIYHPVLLFFSAYYLNEIYGSLALEPPGLPGDAASASHSVLEPGKRFRAAMHNILKLGLVFLAFLLAGFLTSDLGFVLLYAVPIVFILFGIAARFIQEYELKWKAIGALMALPLILFLVLFVASSLLDKIVPISNTGNRTIQRILLTVNPSALENTGLLMTERQLGHERTFVAYSHSGILGGGYMNRPISSALSATALNDNVPATFLLNDFGICGFLAVLLMLFLWVLFWWKNHAGFNVLTFLSLAALLTFTYVDLYMMLSNCGIFLFTGKNFFFWGLNSISDVFHSSLLLFLVTVKTR